MRYVFIINPVAGKGVFQKELIENIKEYFNIHGGEHKILITESPNDANFIARAEAESGDEIRIYACGGEGTSFEVVNGIVGYDNVSLGIIPCGSANDFIKYYGGNNSFLNIENQVNGENTVIDIIKAGEFYCINSCSTGMDAMVAHDMNIFKDWPLVSGKFAYKLAIAKTFLRKLGVNITITLDGGSPESVNCLFAVVANAPYYGGSYIGAPDAKPDDGILNFTLVKKISRIRVFKFLNHYKAGRQKELDYCVLKPCSSLEFSSAKELPVNLDGEIFMRSSMKFEVVKNGINLVLPRGVCSENINNLLVH